MEKNPKKSLAEKFAALHGGVEVNYSGEGGWAFKTKDYCEKREGYTVHIGHGPDEPCPLKGAE